MATVFIHADHVTRNNLLSIHLMNQFCFSSNGLVQEFCEIWWCFFSIACNCIGLQIPLFPSGHSNGSCLRVVEGFTHIGSIIYNGRLIYLAFILF